MEKEYEDKINNKLVSSATAGDYGDSNTYLTNDLQISVSDRWICWKYISEYQILTDEIVERYSLQLDWRCVTCNIRTWSFLTLGNTEFMLKFHDRLDWNDISKFLPFTEVELRQVTSYLNFDHILRLRYHNINTMDSDYDTDYDEDSESEMSVITLAEKFRDLSPIHPINIYVSNQFIQEYRHRFTFFNSNINQATTKKNKRNISYLRVVFRMNRFRDLWKRHAYRVGGVMYRRLYQDYQHQRDKLQV